jgi:hypothetical protein
MQYIRENMIEYHINIRDIITAKEKYKYKLKSHTAEYHITIKGNKQQLHI